MTQYCSMGGCTGWCGGYSSRPCEYCVKRLRSEKERKVHYIQKAVQEMGYIRVVRRIFKFLVCVAIYKVLYYPARWAENFSTWFDRWDLETFGWSEDL